MSIFYILIYYLYFIHLLILFNYLLFVLRLVWCSNDITDQIICRCRFFTFRTLKIYSTHLDVWLTVSEFGEGTSIPKLNELTNRIPPALNTLFFMPDITHISHSIAVSERKIFHRAWVRLSSVVSSLNPARVFQQVTRKRRSKEHPLFTLMNVDRNRNLSE